MACCDLLLMRCRCLQSSAKCKYSHYRSTYCLGLRLRGDDVKIWDCDRASRKFGLSRDITGEPLNSRSRILAPNWREITGVDCIITIWQICTKKYFPRFVFFANILLVISLERLGWFTWHERKCIKWMLGHLCDLDLWPHTWPWPWIFKVKFWNSHNYLRNATAVRWMEQKGCKWMEFGPTVWLWTHDWQPLLIAHWAKSLLILATEWKGYESIKCWTHYLALNFNLSHDLGIEFWDCQVCILHVISLPLRQWSSARPQLTKHNKVWNVCIFLENHCTLRQEIFN